MINLNDKFIKETLPIIGSDAFAVLMAIAVHLNAKTNRCFPGIKRLMSLTGLGRDSVYSAIQKLKDSGLLEVSQQKAEKGRFGRREYRIVTSDISIFMPVSECSPLPEIPYTVAPYTDPPYTVNQEAYLINNMEVVNKKEQINNNNNNKAAAENFQPKNPLEEWIYSAGPGGDNHELLRDAYTVGRKIPSNLFNQHLEAFIAEARLQHKAKPYGNLSEVQKHFLNYAARKYQAVGDASGAGKNQDIYSNLRRR